MFIIDSILDKVKNRADSAEVFQLKSETTGATWASDKLKLAETKETMGIALRVIKNGRIGFFASNKLSDPYKIVDSACELAPFGQVWEGEFPKSYTPASVGTFYKSTADIGTENLIRTGNEMISRAKEAKNEAMFEAKLERAIVQIDIADTFGAHSSFKKSVFVGVLGGSITREGDVINLYEWEETNRADGKTEEMTDILIGKFRDSSEIVSLSPGEYPCLLMPKATAVFGPIQLALNARAVIKDMSPFKDKVGEKVFDSKVTIVDDGLNDSMVGTQPIDDEGVTGQRTILVENGIVRGFIHDLHTAKKMGVKSTGNGMRQGLTTAPRAGYTTLSLLPGKKSVEELIAGMEKGVIIDQIMGAHQASPFSGEFSVSIDLGFVVEKGKIIGRFKDGMLAGNVFRMLKDQVVDIGNKPQYRNWLVPPILLDRMTISTNG